MLLADDNGPGHKIYREWWLRAMVGTRPMKVAVMHFLCDFEYAITLSSCVYIIIFRIQKSVYYFCTSQYSHKNPESLKAFLKPSPKWLQATSNTRKILSYRQKNKINFCAHKKTPICYERGMKNRINTWIYFFISISLKDFFIGLRVEWLILIYIN